MPTPSMAWEEILTSRGCFLDDNSTWSCQEADLRGVSIEGADLQKADFSRADFLDAKIFNSNFSGANFTDSIFTAADLKQVNMARTNLSRTSFNDFNDGWTSKPCTLESVQFTNSNLRSTDFYNAELHDVHFDQSLLINVDYRLAIFDARTSFSESTLIGCDFTESTGAALIGSTLQYSINEAGEHSWKNNRRQKITSDQAKTLLKPGAHLLGLDCSGLNLAAINLSGSTVWGSLFERCDLSNVNMDDSIIRFSNFDNSVLSNSQMSKTDLRGSSFVRTEFHQANLSQAILFGADFRRADLSLAKFHNCVVGGYEFNGENPPNFTDSKLADADLFGLETVFGALSDREIENWRNNPFRLDKPVRPSRVGLRLTTKQRPLK